MWIGAMCGTLCPHNYTDAVMDNKISSPLSRTDLVAILALAALAIALRLVPGLRIIDDAYITYRYARNIAQGIGFVYNPGEHVLGTTTPIYTLLLASLGWLTHSGAYPTISVIINALADGMSVALLYKIGKRLFEHWLPGLVLGLLWAVAPQSVTFAIGGMETSVYLALTLAAFSTWLDGRTLWTASLTALATLTRPDALLWAGPLALAIIVEKGLARRDRPLWQRLPWAEGGIYLALVAPWLIYGTLVFGSPLPHSISAKSVAYILPPTQALIGFIQHYSTPFFDNMTFGATGAMIGGIAYPVLAAMGGLVLAYKDWRSLPMVLFPWLYAAVFIAANPLMFRWYFAVPLPFYFLCIVAGIWGPLQKIPLKGIEQWGLAAAGTLWLILSLRGWVLHPVHGPDRPAPDMAWFQLELLYQQAGQELAPLVDDNTVIAAGDIGAVGWYSGAHILDTLGLVSPQATPYYPLDPSMLATAPYAVAPDLIIKDPRFAEHYRLREKIPTNIYGSDGMLIFEKK
jgi:hypothetical protein